MNSIVHGSLDREWQTGKGQLSSAQTPAIAVCCYLLCEQVSSRTSCIPDVCLSRGEPTNVVSIRHGRKSYHMPTPTANSRLVKNDSAMPSRFIAFEYRTVVSNCTSHPMPAFPSW